MNVELGGGKSVPMLRQQLNKHNNLQNSRYWLVMYKLDNTTEPWFTS